MAPPPGGVSSWTAFKTSLVARPRAISGARGFDRTATGWLPGCRPITDRQSWRPSELRSVELAFRDRRWGAVLLRQAEAAPGGEHRASSRLRRCEACQADSRHVDVDRLHLTIAEVCFVPEPGTAPVPQEALPPLAVRRRPRPPLEGVEIPPVLAHARMRWENGEHQVLVQQQAIRLSLD